MIGSVDPLFSLVHGQCERDDRVLFESVDIVLRAGDLIHLEGPNGVGKTTLLRGIVGLFGGLEGKRQWSVPVGTDGFQTLISYWGHHLAMNPELNVEENLLCSVGLKTHVSPEQCAYALQTVGLAGYEYEHLANLSAGQKQRVGLARLILESKPIWILDEPVAALDVGGVALLEQQLSAHAATGGCALFTSHQPLQLECVRHVTLSRNGLVDSGSGERCQWH